jgi:hypothetical protein
MKTLLNHFVDLCLLRRGPQDIPFSTQLLAGASLLNVLVGVVMIVDVRTGVFSALAESLFDAGLMLAVLYFALRSQNRLARFVQAATALMGSSLLLGLLALPLISWSRNADSGEAGLLLLALIIWSMVVMGHILRHTFEVGLGIGIGLAFAYTLLSWNLALILFPVVN